jgi:16S rRNA (guanine527-N7)-methyltransferase
MSAILYRYFPEISPKQREQFDQLQSLYTLWNDQINVISRKDIEELYERHVLHSLAIAKVIQFKEKSTILDIGTGGGFPGIPLAIMFPKCKFHLVDSIGKKIKVVNEVAKALELTNVKAEHIRAENIEGEYDFIVSRAVTRLSNFLPWTENKTRKSQRNTLRNGIIALKGGDLEEELSEANRRNTVYNLSDYFKEEFFETKKIVHISL